MANQSYGPAEQPPLSILVVDDEEPVRKLLALHLSGLGHSVDTAADNRSALALAADGAHDVVVLDVRMRGEKGLSVIPGLRAGGLGMPVVIFTAYDSDTDAFEAAKLGAAQYVRKGGTLDALVEALEQVTAGQRRDPLDRLAFRLERGAPPLDDQQVRSEIIAAAADQTIDVIAFRHACMAVKMAGGAEARDPREIAATLRVAGRIRRRLGVLTAAILSDLQGDSGAPAPEPEADARQVLKRETQTSYRQWRNLARCQGVVRELTTSDEHVGQLAFRYGFKAHSQFTHLFRQLTGLSPRQVRRIAVRTRGVRRS